MTKVIPFNKNEYSPKEMLEDVLKDADDIDSVCVVVKMKDEENVRYAWSNMVLPHLVGYLEVVQSIITDKLKEEY